MTLYDLQARSRLRIGDLTCQILNISTPIVSSLRTSSLGLLSNGRRLCCAEQPITTRLRSIFYTNPKDYPVTSLGRDKLCLSEVLLVVQQLKFQSHVCYITIYCRAAIVLPRHRMSIWGNTYYCQRMSQPDTN
jgi:hypothetical protein